MENSAWSLSMAGEEVGGVVCPPGSMPLNHQLDPDAAMAFHVQLNTLGNDTERQSGNPMTPIERHLSGLVMEEGRDGLERSSQYLGILLRWKTADPENNSLITNGFTIIGVQR